MRVDHRTSRPTYWPEDLYAKAKQMWADGVTASKIGRELGKSTNAICKLSEGHRDDFPARRNRLNYKKPSINAVVAKMTAKSVDLPVFAAVKCKPLMVPLAEIAPNQCRYIVTDRSRPERVDLMCGQPSDGSWCPAHRRLVYQVPA